MSGRSTALTDRICLDAAMKQAAALLGVGRNRMAWLMREGFVEGEKIANGHMWLVDRSSLLAKRDAWDRNGYPWRRR